MRTDTNVAPMESTELNPEEETLAEVIDLPTWKQKYRPKWKSAASEYPKRVTLREANPHPLWGSPEKFTAINGDKDRTLSGKARVKARKAGK